MLDVQSLLKVCVCTCGCVCLTQDRDISRVSRRVLSSLQQRSIVVRLRTVRTKRRPPLLCFLTRVLAGKFGIELPPPTHVRKGAYYLKSIDAMGRR
jgi:hypothetical protein